MTNREWLFNNDELMMKVLKGEVNILTTYVDYWMCEERCPYRHTCKETGECTYADNHKWDTDKMVTEWLESEYHGIHMNRV